MTDITIINNVTFFGNPYDNIHAHKVLHELIGNFRKEHIQVDLEFLIGIQDYCRYKIELEKLRLRDSGQPTYERVREAMS